jgi:hypothetical protein
MAVGFEVDDYAGETRKVFSHAQSEGEFGASVFWAHQEVGLVIIEDLVEGWQSKRDGTRHGIVEVVE